MPEATLPLCLPRLCSWHLVYLACGLRVCDALPLLQLVCLRIQAPASCNTLLVSPHITNKLSHPRLNSRGRRSAPGVQPLGSYREYDSSSITARRQQYTRDAMATKARQLTATESTTANSHGKRTSQRPRKARW